MGRYFFLIYEVLHPPILHFFLICLLVHYPIRPTAIMRIIPYRLNKIKKFRIYDNYLLSEKFYFISQSMKGLTINLKGMM